MFKVHTFLKDFKLYENDTAKFLVDTSSDYRWVDRCTMEDFV